MREVNNLLDAAAGALYLGFIAEKSGRRDGKHNASGNAGLLQPLREHCLVAFAHHMDVAIENHRNHPFYTSSPYVPLRIVHYYSIIILPGFQAEETIGKTKIDNKEPI